MYRKRILDGFETCAKRARADENVELNLSLAKMYASMSPDFSGTEVPDDDVVRWYEDFRQEVRTFFVKKCETFTDFSKADRIDEESVAFEMDLVNSKISEARARAVVVTKRVDVPTTFDFHGTSMGEFLRTPWLFASCLSKMLGALSALMTETYGFDPLDYPRILSFRE